MTTANTILLVTALASALISGLFYSYSCSVNPGLAQLPNAGYLAAMQAINKAILNPLFFASFIGTLLLLPLSTYMHYSQPVTLKCWLLIASTLIYLVGVFGVTVFGNVPLNEMLAKIDLQASTPDQLAAIRSEFEGSWNWFHTFRTISTVISLILLLAACLNAGDRSV